MEEKKKILVAEEQAINCSLSRPILKDTYGVLDILKRYADVTQRLTDTPQQCVFLPERLHLEFTESAYTKSSGQLIKAAWMKKSFPDIC